MVDSVVDTQLPAEDIPTPRRAVETTAAVVVAMPTQRPRAATAAQFAEARIMADVDITAAGDIMAAADTMAPDLDSAWACMRLTATAMRLQFATLPGSITHTEPGSHIPVARFRTVTKSSSARPVAWRAAKSISSREIWQATPEPASASWIQTKRAGR